MIVAVLPGDGIGREVTQAAVEVATAAVGDGAVDWRNGAMGYDAWREHGKGFPDPTRALCEEADAVLLGAVGSPEAPKPGEKAPDVGLLDLRLALGAWANIRPVKPMPELFDSSPLRPERLEGVDILFVRELTGGIYFGKKSRTEDHAEDLCEYSRPEIERVVRRACELARERNKRVTSVDKSNVLETSRLWRIITQEIVDREFPDITLDHVLVDAMAMHLMSRPADFDVIVTENMFGDILTDEASMLAGSMGMLPSASLGDGKGLYEPIHGTAPDIAGQGVANPYAAILSVAMLLRWSVAQPDAAARIEAAVEQAIRDDIKTRDLGGRAGTVDVTRAVIERL